MTTNHYQGHQITVERTVVGHAYARNGKFTASVDGRPVCSNPRRGYVVVVAKAYIDSGEVNER